MSAYLARCRWQGIQESWPPGAFALRMIGCSQRTLRSARVILPCDAGCGRAGLVGVSPGPGDRTVGRAATRCRSAAGREQFFAAGPTALGRTARRKAGQGISKCGGRALVRCPDRASFAARRAAGHVAGSTARVVAHAARSHSNPSGHPSGRSRRARMSSTASSGGGRGLRCRTISAGRRPPEPP